MYFIQGALFPVLFPLPGVMSAVYLFQFRRNQTHIFLSGLDTRMSKLLLNPFNIRSLEFVSFSFKHSSGTRHPEAVCDYMAVSKP